MLIFFVLKHTTFLIEWLISSKNEIVQSNEPKEPKGDPEMAAIYLKRLMPVFCHTFQSTMLPSIRLFILINKYKYLMYNVKNN